MAIGGDRRGRRRAAGPTRWAEGDAPFLAALERGRKAQLELWDAVAIALGELEPSQAAQ